MTERKLIRVREVMKTHFDMVNGMATVAEALQQMHHVETKSLIVDKRQDEDEYGMVMLSDISREVLALDRSPERVNIYEIMSKPVISIDPEMDIRYCARLFERFNISRAPVVENRKIIGIVSHTDMVLRGMEILQMKN
ncbi:CBS domain-containing protein [Thiolapillus sp.]|uniref:CBS domain-containing protein n=1 Tax=Thiolapillus sp. TaxID=2017437 RepID=UPI003AF7CBAC